MYGSSASTNARVRNIDGEGASGVEAPGIIIGTVDAFNTLPKESVAPPEKVSFAIDKDKEDKEEGIRVCQSFASRGGETAGRNRRVVGGLGGSSRVASRSAASVDLSGWLKTA
jgi:hypothetical protein